jgi:hypothetical protein
MSAPLVESKKRWKPQAGFTKGRLSEAGSDGELEHILDRVECVRDGCIPIGVAGPMGEDTSVARLARALLRGQGHGLVGRDASGMTVRLMNEQTHLDRVARMWGGDRTRSVTQPPSQRPAEQGSDKWRPRRLG